MFYPSALFGLISISVRSCVSCLVFVFMNIYMLLWYICLYVFIIYVMNILYVSFLIYHFVEWRSNCSTTTGNKHIVYFLCFLLTYTVCVYKQINDINITTDMYGCIIIIYIHCITSYAELDVLFTVCAHN